MSLPREGGKKEKEIQQYGFLSEKATEETSFDFLIFYSKFADLNLQLAHDAAG